MDGGAWWAAVHGVAKSQTWLSDFTFAFHFYALEKEMVTHSSVLAWRIPGMGSHRVGHDWSDLAVAGVYKITEGAGREVLWVRVQTKLLETTSYSLNHVITSMTRKTVAAAGNRIWRPVTAEPSWFWPSFVPAKEMPHFLPLPCLTGLPGHLLQVLVIGRRRSHAGS